MDRLKTPTNVNRLFCLPEPLEYVRSLMTHAHLDLMSEYKNAAGDPFVYRWSDCDNRRDRYLLVQTTPEVLSQVVAGDEPILTLFTDRIGPVYIVDKAPKTEAIEAVWQCTEDPTEYFPHETGRLDPDWVD